MFVKLPSLCWNFLSPKLAPCLSQALPLFCVYTSLCASLPAVPTAGLLRPLCEARSSPRPARLVQLWAPVFLVIGCLQQPHISQFPFSDSFWFSGPSRLTSGTCPFQLTLGPLLTPVARLWTPELALVCLPSLALHCPRWLALGPIELLCGLVSLTAR